MERRKEKEREIKIMAKYHIITVIQSIQDNFIKITKRIDYYHAIIQ